MTCLFAPSVAVYSGISYFREKKSISRVFRR
ncbi:small membrane protein [Klebsiella pneumoniae]|nr:small membrane protein [Klebsiella pneumoniae]